MEVSDLCFIDDAGYHYADYPTYLTFFTTGYQTIYGADVYLGPDSQDGQWIAVQAKAAFDTAANGAKIYSSFSPATGQGTGLSRTVKINGLNRGIPTFSTADLTVGGVVGTPLTNCVAIDTLKQKWNIPAVTIPSAGTVVVTATAQVQGDLSAEAGTINGIFTPTSGWQTVTNVAAATEGAPVESDAELRLRQQTSTANPSLTVIEGSNGAVGNIPGVTNVRTYENDDGTTDGNGIPGHKICTVVAGGDAMSIASIIALHKTPGAGTFGNTTENVFDAEGIPIAISFQRPTVAHIQATVTITTLNGYSSGFAALIQQAVAAVINGFQIGSTVLITKLYYPSYLNGAASGQTYDVVSITIGKNGGGQSDANITLDFDELPECDPTTDIVIVTT